MHRYPLHAAAYAGDVSLLRVLVKRGGNVALRDARGCTPLHKAAGNGQLAAVRFLLHKKADHRAKSHAGETPRDIALRYAHTACVGDCRGACPAGWGNK